MKLKVMLIDDEPFILQGLTLLIDWEKEGCEIVRTAANGMEALDYLTEHTVDLILADIATAHGWELDSVNALRKLRTSSQCVDENQQKVRLRESLIICRK